MMPTAAPFLLVPLIACSALAQEAPAPPARPKSAVILKDEVDALVRELRRTAHRDGGLGDGSCRQTAMVLAAAGSCHRYYHAGDGPWVRKALATLIVRRRGDGAFADGAGDDAALTTSWVLAALRVMDPHAYQEEIEAGRAFLERAGQPVADPFDELVESNREAARESADPIDALQAEGKRALQELPSPSGGASDPAAAARALVALVSCQAAARERTAAAEPAAASVTWSPVQERGFAFLLAQQADGVFAVEFGGARYPDVGLTGIGLAALLTKPPSLRSAAEAAVIDEGISWLLAQQGEDGSIGQTNVNYSTCAAVMALASHGDPRCGEALARAQRYILGIQNVEAREYSPGDRDYGSIGYGGDERGDLSNLQFALEALRSTGLDQNHEAFHKAIVFLQRTQNLVEYNDFKGRTREDGAWHDVAPGDDGGSAYYPGNSPAGYLELPDGTRVPRSYGSMTYALLKAYTLCGLPASDPRVKAAVAWIRDNWTLEVNPGVDPELGADAAHQGLYYYYMVMAQALALADIEAIEVADGKSVSWRSALAKHLESVQRADGSWLNARNSRWWEDQPLVCTVYCMLALDRCGERPR